MAIENRYIADRLVINTSTTDVYIPQLSEISFSPALDTQVGELAGAVDPENAALVRGNSPAFTGATEAVAIFLNQAGISGAVLSATNKLDLYMRRKQFGGTRASGSVHDIVSIANGLLVPTSISAGDTSFAKINFAAYACSSDGTTSPVGWTASSAMDATAATRELFFAGPVKINTTTLAGVRSIDIDMGLDIELDGGSGNLWPYFVCIRQRRPSATIVTADWDGVRGLFSATNLLSPGVDIGASTVIYLRKAAANGQRVAAATEEHISFTPTDGIIQFMGSNAGGDATLKFTPLWDGTNSIIGIDTTAAIA